MNALGIFSCLLCEDKLDLDIISIQKYAYNLMQTTEGRAHSNMGGWQSGFVDNDQELSLLVLEINKRLEGLRSIINFNDNLVLKVESMWININPTYSYNTRHIHPGSYMSGSFYVKTPNNSGTLMLKHPALNSMYILRNHDIFKTYNDVNSAAWSIPPVENKLVMFPGWVEHEVSQNLSGEDRISIAFNTTFYERN